MSAGAQFAVNRAVAAFPDLGRRGFGDLSGRIVLSEVDAAMSFLSRCQVSDPPTVPVGSIIDAIGQWRRHARPSVGAVLCAACGLGISIARSSGRSGLVGITEGSLVPVLLQGRG